MRGESGAIKQPDSQGQRRTLQTLLANGATSIIRCARQGSKFASARLLQLLQPNCTRSRSPLWPR